jgi:hypothetical protein
MRRASYVKLGSMGQLIAKHRKGDWAAPRGLKGDKKMNEEGEHGRRTR